ncbi:uncharacterized protein LOC133732807 isoform X3 [Rosa rugosa]|uniref:uncharacterized protein LOC133732807 isoform X3 n=1 Tax=Rosa rugosa TaxID=74645 RepID=UPI002B416DA9|nr:uncharacterized protein LOC133732807 isoform X3 [Rosa rugosa]XP_062016378.1 uncharacterized protein LOC133732807 isoform X3 [Rosa rugosa]
MHKLLFWASGQTPLKDFSAAQPSWRPKSDKDTQLQFFFHIFSILLVLRQFVLSPNLGFVPLLGRIRDGLEVRNQFGEGNTCMGLQRKVSQYSKLETWRVAFLCEESAFYSNFGKSGALCIGEPSNSKIDTLYKSSTGAVVSQIPEFQNFDSKV